MSELILEASVNWTTVYWSIGVMAGLALILAIVINVVQKLFAVKKDSRVEEITALLPGANCGGCGNAGCAGFAEKLVSGEGNINDCGQLTPAAKAEIGAILGITVSGEGETMAVVACSGGNQCADKYVYQGYGDCKSQNIMAGGKKQCATGCMGTGSCVDACPYYAIEVREGVAEVNPALCVSCGNCIAACPKKLIKRIPKDAKIYVACSSNKKGKDITLVCKAGCIGCGLCQRVCQHDAIHLVNNVPVIDYSKCVGCLECLNKCPRHVIKQPK